jgi:hypothetical protein
VEIGKEEISESKETTESDKPVIVNLEAETTQQTSVPATTNEVEIDNDYVLVEKPAEIPIEEDNKMDIDTEPIKEATQDDKANVEVVQPEVAPQADKTEVETEQAREVSESDKMEIDEVIPVLETKEEPTRVQDEVQDDNKMDIDPIPAVEQVESISKDEPLIQEPANDAQTVIDKPIEEQLETQVENVQKVSQDDKMEIDEQPEVQIENAAEAPKDDKMDIDEDPKPETEQTEQTAEVSQDDKMEVDEEPKLESQTVPELPQIDKMEIDEEPKPEAQVQPSEDQVVPSMTNQEPALTLESKPQDNLLIEQTNQTEESLSQSNLVTEAESNIPTEAIKPELDGDSTSVPSAQSTEPIVQQEPTQPAKEPTPEPEKLPESTLEATASLLGDIGTFPQPEPIDFSGTAANQSEVSESTKGSNDSPAIVAQPEPVKESESGVEQVNNESVAEASTVNLNEVKEPEVAPAQVSDVNINESVKEQPQVVVESSLDKEEPKEDISKPSILGLVGDYQSSSSPGSESEPAQVAEKVELPTETTNQSDAVVEVQNTDKSNNEEPSQPASNPEVANSTSIETQSSVPAIEQEQNAVTDAPVQEQDKQ